MKRKSIYVGLVMATAVLFGLAGCKKDEGEKVVLGTQFEKAVSVQKTWLGENNSVCWSAGDSVNVNSNKYVAGSSISVTEADHYYAVYPYSSSNTVGENGGTVEIPASQTYTVDGNGVQQLKAPMAARLDNKNGILFFKNLYSLLRVKVSAYDKDFTVNSITVTATGSEAKPLAGTYTYTFRGATTEDTASAPTVSDITSGGSTSVTLTCSSNNLVSAYADKDFYLAVHPINGQSLKVEVRGMLDGKLVVYTYSSATTHKLSRSRIGGLAINLQQLQPVMGIGFFSVASDRYVTFSSGNLQWSAINGGTWRFAEHQWDYIGDANENIAQNYTGWIDLFGWGTSGYNSKYPYMTSDTNEKYGAGESNIAGTNYDWGVYNAIQSYDGSTTYPAGTWRTLTKGEWVYLIQTRTNASKLYKAGVTVCGKSNCLIIAPDGFTGTIETSYDASAWSAAEAAGLVCLPAAGYRSGTSVSNAGSNGNYWSSTYYGSIRAYDLNFGGSGTNTFTGYRSSARSVRLVKDVK